VAKIDPKLTSFHERHSQHDDVCGTPKFGLENMHSNVFIAAIVGPAVHVAVAFRLDTSIASKEDKFWMTSESRGERRPKTSSMIPAITSWMTET
jgi:hypothetical protein